MCRECEYYSAILSDPYRFFTFSSTIDDNGFKTYSPVWQYTIKLILGLVTRPDASCKDPNLRWVYGHDQSLESAPLSPTDKVKCMSSVSIRVQLHPEDSTRSRGRDGFKTKTCPTTNDHDNASFLGGFLYRWGQKNGEMQWDIFKELRNIKARHKWNLNIRNINTHSYSHFNRPFTVIPSVISLNHWDI